jgi:hypothetical protein
VRDRVAGDGVWVEKFWLPVNTPVFGGDSRDITYIIHHVADATQAVVLRRWIAEQELLLAEQCVTLDRMRQELRCVQRELRAARRSRPVTEITPLFVLICLPCGNYRVRYRIIYPYDPGRILQCTVRMEGRL